MALILLTAEEGGLRLDQFLAVRMEELTRSAAQKLLEEGRVTREGRPLKKNERTLSGGVYAVDLPEPEPLDVLPQNIPLDVRYEDGDVVVLSPACASFDEFSCFEERGDVFKRLVADRAGKA